MRRTRTSARSPACWALFGELLLRAPGPLGDTVTVRDVLSGRRSTDEWARDVWDAWAAHHGTVRAWLSAALA